MIDHDELKLLLPFAAMGRLESDEETAIATHLQSGCDDCEGELRAFHETLAALAFAESEGRSDSDQVWARLARRLPQKEPRAFKPERPSRASRSRRVTGFAIAAAVLTSTCAGYFASRLQSEQHQSVARLTALQARNRDLAEVLRRRNIELTDLRAQISESTELTRAIVAPEAHVIKLAPMPTAPHASGVLAMVPPQAHCMAAVMGLPPLPSNKIYELWWIGAKSGPMPAATFLPGVHGGAIIAAKRPPQGEEILASAVTMEPMGGTDRPTGAMYLKGIL